MQINVKIACNRVLMGRIGVKQRLTGSDSTIDRVNIYITNGSILQ